MQRKNKVNIKITVTLKIPRLQTCIFKVLIEFVVIRMIMNVIRFQLENTFRWSTWKFLWWQSYFDFTTWHNLCHLHTSVWLSHPHCNFNMLANLSELWSFQTWLNIRTAIPWSLVESPVPMSFLSASTKPVRIYANKIRAERNLQSPSASLTTKCRLVGAKQYLPLVLFRFTFYAKSLWH